MVKPHPEHPDHSTKSCESMAVQGKKSQEGREGCHRSVVLPTVKGLWTLLDPKISGNGVR